MPTEFVEGEALVDYPATFFTHWTPRYCARCGSHTYLYSRLVRDYDTWTGVRRRYWSARCPRKRLWNSHTDDDAWKAEWFGESFAPRRTS